ncbi:MAG: hypothetical protein ACRC9T_06030 [Vibrionaceae bacterium]
MDSEKRKRGRPVLADDEQSFMMRFRIKPELLESLKAAANESGSTMTSVITSSLEHYLAAKK